MQLSEDPVSSIRDFVVQPGSVLPARSTFFVYLNNMVFCVLKGKLMSFPSVSFICSSVNFSCVYIGCSI